MSRPRRRTARPRLEVLENRTLLSTYTVDHLADDMVGSGFNGSLRYCIIHAVDGDHIGFAPDVTGTINLTGALPNLSHSISIDGPGADLMTVDAGGGSRIFSVIGYDIAAKISGLTIANGTSDK